ncbi:molybdopterin-guanine dinucleotide biosynthesis protein B [Arenibaculum pallidiluteum]|uniref:molybdopterin-guanine dinucleotide biosynthesis protein B n=1 Tax=Arenibaculum pallidiluteum TaxID=2812559 RepID=UPI001A962A39|nr:molybdopterin-guanine dinucleotide biosynthesis protein B [Arenibaculum pallidiluteum]
MRIFGLAGWSGSGKTTLMVRLVPELVSRGLRVSTVKHAHHAFDVDQPGKDSYEHRRAGATEVMVTSANRWALMHENRGDPEPALDELVARMTPVDLLLVEGFKRGSHPKIEVFRRANGKALLALNDPSILAVASDGPVPEVAVPVLDLDRVDSVADFILAAAGLDRAGG